MKLFPFVLLCWTVAAPAAESSVRVINGDFSDLRGLTAGPDGWYGGLPQGWSGSGHTYAIHDKRGTTPPTCNPSTLGFFRQRVGVLDKASDVVLTFDVSEPWNPESARRAETGGCRAVGQGPRL